MSLGQGEAPQEDSRHAGAEGRKPSKALPYEGSRDHGWLRRHDRCIRVDLCTTAGTPSHTHEGSWGLDTAVSMTESKMEIN